MDHKTCPYCQEHDAYATMTDFNNDATELHRQCECSICGRHWIEVYVFEGILLELPDWLKHGPS